MLNSHWEAFQGSVGHILLEMEPPPSHHAVGANLREVFLKVSIFEERCFRDRFQLVLKNYNSRVVLDEILSSFIFRMGDALFNVCDHAVLTSGEPLWGLSHVQNFYVSVWTFGRTIQFFLAA